MFSKIVVVSLLFALSVIQTAARVCPGVDNVASSVRVPNPPVQPIQASYSRPDVGLSGTWYNELGSTMNLTAEDGNLTGFYNSAVGNATNYYVLAGRYDLFPPSGGGVSLGWTVTYRNEFRNAHSTATWSGQYFVGDVETILTQWLLTTSTTPSSVWQSTNIGHDEFTRYPPNNQAEIVKALALTADSPHPEDILSHFFKF